MKLADYLQPGTEYRVTVDETSEGFTRPVMRLTFTPVEGEPKAFTVHGPVVEVETGQPEG